MAKVLLQNEADRKRYEELAEMYFDKYPNLIESREEGFIWADLEIREWQNGRIRELYP